MNRQQKYGSGWVLLLLLAGLTWQHLALRQLRRDLGERDAKLAQLADGIAALQQRHSEPAATAPDHTAELLALRGEISRLNQRISELDELKNSLSRRAAAREAEERFVYQDSTKRKDYTFTGYANPQSALQSVLWSITQLDAKAFQASISGTIAESFASSFKELPEGVMPGGFKNGAMFKASGFRIMEETAPSEDELHLKVFLEGSQIVIKPVFKKMNGEWKWASND